VVLKVFALQSTLSMRAAAVSLFVSHRQPRHNCL
jgi:hypothetical protein